MIAVAIFSLDKDPLGVDAEARALARDLGSGVYEARLKLSQPLPIIVHRTSDGDAARALATSLRARGHDVVALDETHVPEPIVVRTFRFGEAFECGAEAIAYTDIVALVRAAR